MTIDKPHLEAHSEHVIFAKSPITLTKIAKKYIKRKKNHLEYEVKTVVHFPLANNSEGVPDQSYDKCLKTYVIFIEGNPHTNHSTVAQTTESLEINSIELSLEDKSIRLVNETNEMNEEDESQFPVYHTYN